jgi:hypothetical protein
MTKWVHTCDAFGASLYQRSQKGRFRSGQTGQTVNLLALRLRWFESSPAHFFVWRGHPGCGANPKAFGVDRSNRLEFANRAED